MAVLDIISMVVGAILGAFGLYFAVIAVFGLKARKSDFASAAPCKKIAVLIAARNEETVIGQLIESLKKQDYPRELYQIIVMPNNCTDQTETAARDAGARILFPDKPVHSKGDALACAFRQLIHEDFDAFCVFDADNVVDALYLRAVNNALCAGARVAQGYRDSKNPTVSWVSACSSIFYWFMNRLYNHARRVIGASASLNGTGFMVSADVIRQYGWETKTLTEDLEFTAQCAIRGETIRWMDDAITYDEQPEGIMDSMAQRRRWFGGAWQCKRYYLRPLMKTRSLLAVDMSLLFGSVYFQVGGLIPILLSLLSMTLYAVSSPEYLTPFLIMIGISLFGSIVSMQAFAALVCLLEKKPLGKMAKGIVFFPLFMLTWMLANLSCVLTGPPKWRQIRHKAVPDKES